MGCQKYAGRFHCDLTYVQRTQPLAERDQIAGHRAEGTRLLTLWRDHTRHHRPLVDIQSTAPFVDYPHRLTPFSGRWRLAGGLLD
jgi:hypothetical protein